MHKITIIGHLGRDPEMRYTPEGQAVSTFSLASSRKYKTAAGEQREETEWFNVSAWGKLAEICNQYLTKGKQVYVEGRLKTRTYQGQSGETRFSIDVTCQEIQFLGGGQGRDQDQDQDQGQDKDQDQDQGQDREPVGAAQEDVDDLPF